MEKNKQIKTITSIELETFNNKNVYLPSKEVLKRQDYHMQRSMELDRIEAKNVAKWQRERIIYGAEQLEDDEESIPRINSALELEIIESKIAEEIKISPFAIIEAIDKESEIKVEAINDIVEHVKSINNYNDLTVKLYLGKSTYGTMYQKIEFLILKRKKTVNGKKIDIIDFKDIKITNIDPQYIRMSEGIERIEDAPEIYEYCFMDYKIAEAKFGEYPNWKYVRPGEYWTNPMGKNEYSRFWGSRSLINRTVEVMYYYNAPDDIYNIIVNGVLLTEVDNPMPFGPHIKYPFVKCINRLNPNDRHGISEIELINPFKKISNIFLNTLVKTNLLAANPIIKTTKWSGVDDNNSIQAGGFMFFNDRESLDSTQVMNFPVNNNLIGFQDVLDRRLTAQIGVDSKSLINQQAETATKTAVKKESSMKRINLGASLMGDFFLEQMRLLVRTIEYFYGDFDLMVKYKVDFKNNPDLAVPEMKKIPVKGKTYEYNWGTNLLSKNKNESNFSYGKLEIVPDLFKDVNYLVNLKASNEMAGMKTYKLELLQNAMATLLQFPNNVNTDLLIETYAEEMGLPSKVVKTAEEIQQAKQQEQAQIQQQQEQQMAMGQAPQSQAQLQAPIPNIPGVNK